MQKRIYIPLHTEHLHILIKWCSWTVTKLYSLDTFEQRKFEKDFVFMNQESRQKLKAKVEKDFYKLLNNANFGYDCRNNADNCFFSPVFDEIEEIYYVKKYQNLFDPEVSDFVSSELLEMEIEDSFSNNLMKLNQNDPYYKDRKHSLKIQRAKDLDVILSMKLYKKKKHLRNSTKKIDEKQKNLKMT